MKDENLTRSEEIVLPHIVNGTVTVSCKKCELTYEFNNDYLLSINYETKTGKKVMVSGGFDPPHVGHILMFEEAKKYGDILIVVVNNDNWLRKKKGFVFMSETDRLKMIKSFRCVDEVVLTSHSENTSDMSVCNELRQLKPDVFANGGDRFADNIPEFNVCNELGIEMVFNVGGDKIRSSSDMIKNVGLNSILPKN